MGMCAMPGRIAGTVSAWMSARVAGFWKIVNRDLTNTGVDSSIIMAEPQSRRAAEPQSRRAAEPQSRRAAHEGVRMAVVAGPSILSA